jgi:hypothetical protein
MNEKIEELRKRAYLLYGGPKGVELVNRQMRKNRQQEDKLEGEELKEVLNDIIQSVFIDYIGPDKTREILLKKVTHISGYKRSFTEKQGKIRIFEHVHFSKMLVVFIGFLVVLLVAYWLFYASSFNPLDLCEKKKDPELKDACYMSIAMSTRDTILCGKIGLRDKVLNCLSSVAVMTNDSNICKQIPVSDLSTLVIHDKCITCVAFSLRNATLCRSFADPNREDECKRQLTTGRSLIC